MHIRFTHLSGANAQHVEAVESCPILLGRDPACQVRFDQFKELAVSGQHAQIDEVREGEFQITCLGRNGILVNGRIIEANAPLPNHATIQLGKDGPRVRFDVDRNVGGVSRTDVQRKTGKLKRDELARKRPVTEEHPVYRPPELDEPPPAQGLPVAAIAIGVGVAIIGVVVAIYFALA